MNTATSEPRKVDKVWCGLDFTIIQTRKHVPESRRQRRRRCVAVWLCGCVAVWLCGCVTAWLCGCVAVHTNRVPAVSDLVPHNSHAQQSLAWLAMMVMRPRCTRFVLCFTTFLAVPLTLAVG